MYSTMPYYVRSLTSTFASLDGGSFLKMVSTMMRHMHHGFKPCKARRPHPSGRTILAGWLSSFTIFQRSFVAALLKAPSVLWTVFERMRLLQNMNCSSSNKIQEVEATNLLKKIFITSPLTCSYVIIYVFFKSSFHFEWKWTWGTNWYLRSLWCSLDATWTAQAVGALRALPSFGWQSKSGLEARMKWWMWTCAGTCWDIDPKNGGKGGTVYWCILLYIDIIFYDDSTAYIHILSIILYVQHVLFDYV